MGNVEERLWINVVGGRLGLYGIVGWTVLEIAWCDAKRSLCTCISLTILMRNVQPRNPVTKDMWWYAIRSASKTQT